MRKFTEKSTVNVNENIETGTRYRSIKEGKNGYKFININNISIKNNATEVEVAISVYEGTKHVGDFSYSIDELKENKIFEKYTYVGKSDSTKINDTKKNPPKFQNKPETLISKDLLEAKLASKGYGILYDDDSRIIATKDNYMLDINPRSITYKVKSGDSVLEAATHFNVAMFIPSDSEFLSYVLRTQGMNENSDTSFIETVSTYGPISDITNESLANIQPDSHYSIQYVQGVNDIYYNLTGMSLIPEGVEVDYVAKYKDDNGQDVTSTITMTYNTSLKSVGLKD